MKMPDGDTNNLDPNLDNQGSEGVGAKDAQVNVDWKNGIAEEFRQDPALEKFKSPNDLYKSYKNLEKFVGKEKLVLPKDENDKEAWDQVFEKLGRPGEVSGYKLPEVEVSEDLRSQISPEGVKSYLEFAHSIGLSNKQASALYEWHLKNTDAGIQQVSDSRLKMMQDSETELRRDLGAAYNERIGVARRVYDAFKSDKDSSFFKEHGNDPRLIRFLANIGSKLSEDALGPGQAKGFLKTPAEAEAEYNKIVNDLGSPYYDETHHEHSAYVDKVESLIKAMHAKV